MTRRDDQRSTPGHTDPHPADGQDTVPDGRETGPRRGEPGYRHPRHPSGADGGAAGGAGGGGRRVPVTSVVTGVIVRVAGVVPVRMDLTHVGTIEQTLGISAGKILIYMRSGITARALTRGWAETSVHAQALRPAIPGQRRLPVGPSSVAAMVQLGGVPVVRAAVHPAREGGAVPAVLRVQVGPLMWEVCDASAYESLARAWRHAARLLGDNPLDDD